MPYQLGWLVKGRVLEVRLIGRCQADEIRLLDQQVVRELQSYPNSTIHLLFDVTELDYLPALSTMRTIESIYQPNVGLGINFGPLSPVIRSIIIGLARLVGIRQRFFSTRKRALHFLMSIEPDLILPPDDSR